MIILDFKSFGTSSFLCLEWYVSVFLFSVEQNVWDLANFLKNLIATLRIRKTPRLITQNVSRVSKYQYMVQLSLNWLRIVLRELMTSTMIELGPFRSSSETLGFFLPSRLWHHYYNPYYLHFNMVRVRINLEQTLDLHTINFFARLWYRISIVSFGIHLSWTWTWAFRLGVDWLGKWK